MFQSLTGRLKTKDAELRRALARMFQSLTGRLKTGLQRSEFLAGQCRFQSLTGRLKTRDASAVGAGVAEVSIPHR